MTNEKYSSIYWKLLKFHAVLVEMRRRKMMPDCYRNENGLDSFDALCRGIIHTGDPADFAVFIQRAQGILLPQILQEAIDNGKLKFM